MNSFKRILICSILPLLCCASSGCAAVAISRVVAEADRETEVASELVDRAQASRLAAGLTLEQFDEEMWKLVPEDYAKVQKKRIRDYVREFGAKRSGPNAGTERGWEYSLRHDFPELKSKYDVIHYKHTKLASHQNLWDLKSVAYRAKRLENDAKEKIILDELRTYDLFFERRYERLSIAKKIELIEAHQK